MNRLSLLVALATVAATAGRPTSSQESAVDPVEATVKAWSDVKLWIIVGGQRSGWMRYRARWAEYGGDKVVEVNVERATTGRYSQRFTSWLNPDKTLSPRAVRYAHDGYDWENVNGRMGMFKTPTPDNLSLLPEFLAAAQLPREGDSLALVLIDEYNDKGAEATLKGAGADTKAAKVALTAKAAHFAARGGDATFWIGENRALTRARVSFAAKDKAPPEEWVPATDKEWTQGDAASNEFRAACHLTLLTNLVMHFRAHDAEGNSKNDFWSGDVSGLYRCIAKRSGEPIALISREMAMADAAPLPPGPEKGGGTIADSLTAKPVPLNGYLFRAMTHGRLTRGEVPLNDGSNRNSDMFGFCVYPASYGKSGRKTYFVNEDNNIYSKDLKGEPILEVPADPLRNGWALVRRF